MNSMFILIKLCVSKHHHHHQMLYPLLIFRSDALETTSLVALAIAVLFVWSMLNCLRVENMGWMNNIATVIQVLTIIALVAVVLSFAPTLNTGSYVFFTYNNNTGYESQSYVIFLSFLFPLFGFVGTYSIYICL
jgi:amino acid transporter